MRDESFQTTLGYINKADALDEAIQGMDVPDSLQSPDGDVD